MGQLPFGRVEVVGAPASGAGDEAEAEAVGPPATGVGVAEAACHVM